MDSAVLFFPLRAGRLSIAPAFAQHSVNKHKTRSNYREYLPKIQMFQDLASPFIPLCPSSETFLLSPSGYQCSLLDSLSLSPYPSSFNLSASQIHEFLRPIDVDHVLSSSNSIEPDSSSTPSNSIEPMILVSTFQSDLLPWLFRRPAIGSAPGRQAGSRRQIPDINVNTFYYTLFPRICKGGFEKWCASPTIRAADTAGLGLHPSMPLARPAGLSVPPCAFFVDVLPHGESKAADAQTSPCARREDR